MEFLPCSLVKSYTRKQCISSILTQTSFCRWRSRKKGCSILQILHDLIDHHATVVTLLIQFLAVHIKRSSQQLCISIELYQLKVQISAEPQGLTFRSSDGGLVIKILSVLQQEVGVVDTFVECGIVTVSGRDRIGALTVGINTTGTYQV